MPSSQTAVLLHIGTQKTGTTSIQRVLCAHADRLEAAGVLYPVSGRPAEDAIKYGHHALAREAIKLARGRATETPVIDDLLREIDETRPRRVIISSEDFWTPHDPQALAQVIGDVTTDIVVSLRRQDEYLNAMYYTTVCADRHGLSPEEYAAGAIKGQLDYLTMIEGWRKAFPEARLTIRLYEPGLGPRVDAVGDFLGLTGLNRLITKEESSIHTHKTLPARAVAALRVLSKNDLTPMEFYNIFDATHLALADKNEETFSYSPQFRANLLREHHAGNVELRQRFLDGQNASIFKEPTFESDEEWRRRVIWGDEAVARLMLDIANSFRMRVYLPPKP
jgi:hypothetical protein